MSVEEVLKEVLPSVDFEKGYKKVPSEQPTLKNLNSNFFKEHIKIVGVKDEQTNLA